MAGEGKCSPKGKVGSGAQTGMWSHPEGWWEGQCPGL